MNPAKLNHGLNILLVLVLGPMTALFAQSNRNITKPTIPFRYVITENSIDDPDDPKIASRHIELLLDQRSFSEQNLKLLFTLVSKRFPQPNLLFVDVYTSLEQAPTPEERDLGGTSNLEDQTNNRHLWAIYVRNKNDEYFRYSPVNDLFGNKLVQLSQAIKEQP
ncbi:MAG: hypothetical protein JNJ39_13800 [Blastocatellia bacterium]|nr:hypothetical protein [Blastocatellia bacterium]